MSPVLRTCFRNPIPEIQEAAGYLDGAVSAHLAGDATLADFLIGKADIPAIREWTESIWGAASPYVIKTIHLAAPEESIRALSACQAAKRRWRSTSVMDTYAGFAEFPLSVAWCGSR
jgi:hypothetical protein